MPVLRAVADPAIAEHVDIVQRVWTTQPVLDHSRHLHGVPLARIESLEGGDDAHQTWGWRLGLTLRMALAMTMWPHCPRLTWGNIHCIDLKYCQQLDYEPC